MRKFCVTLLLLLLFTAPEIHALDLDQYMKEQTSQGHGYSSLMSLPVPSTPDELKRECLWIEEQIKKNIGLVKALSRLVETVKAKRASDAQKIAGFIIIEQLKERSEHIGCLCFQRCKTLTKGSDEKCLDQCAD